MDVSLFDFDLPESAIALRPASPRDSAKLLQVSSVGELSDHHVYDLPDLLKAGDVLVLNETRVLRAALKAIRPAREHGGGGDVTLDVNLLARTASDSWQAFVRPAKRVKAGDSLSFGTGLTAIVADKGEGGLVMLSFLQTGDDLDAAIEVAGSPPLPPYIGRKRSVDSRDEQDYQTVYAKDTGSVAAPTAGLHFTPALLEALENKGVTLERLTLHVGAGTFLPVKTDDTDDHDMHSEWYSIAPDVAARINQAKQDGRRIIAVGTTSLRALESAAKDGELAILTQETDIFITPGYRFKVVDGLMTNFHLPKSTLFMLVSAFSGRKSMKKAYKYAIDANYRFYSYGDSNLLWLGVNWG